MLHGSVPGSWRSGLAELSDSSAIKLVQLTRTKSASRRLGSMNVLSERQTASSLIRLGRHVRFRADVDVTPAGLLGITVLVCGILLSTSVLVATAIRESRGLR